MCRMTAFYFWGHFLAEQRPSKRRRSWHHLCFAIPLPSSSQVVGCTQVYPCANLRGHQSQRIFCPHGVSAERAALFPGCSPVPTRRFTWTSTISSRQPYLEQLTRVRTAVWTTDKDSDHQAPAPLFPGHGVHLWGLGEVQHGAGRSDIHSTVNPCGSR